MTEVVHFIECFEGEGRKIDYVSDVTCTQCLALILAYVIDSLVCGRWDYLEKRNFYPGTHQ